MNIERLKYNTPVLIQTIKKEFNLSNEDIAKVFNLHPRIIKLWQDGTLRPDEDYINALILAYRFVKITRPLKWFVKVLIQSITKIKKAIFRAVQRRFSKTDQIKLI